MAPTSHFVTINGLRMHYLDWGGNGPPAILAHAMGFNANTWAPLAESLSSWYRVIAPDLRGHGSSEAAIDRDYSWQIIGQDMASFLQKLDVHGALGVGHSYGGAALLLGGAHSPGHLECAVLFEPAPALYPLKKNRNEIPIWARPRKRRIDWDNFLEIFQSYSKKDTLRYWKEEYIKSFIDGNFRLKDDGGMTRRQRPETEAEMIGKAKPYAGMWNDLARYNVPTLIVMGLASEWATQDSPPIQKLLAISPKIRFLWESNATHYMPMECPDRFEEMIWEFAASTRATSKTY